MEIQKINPIQTICLNGKKFWRAFDVSEDCFKIFARLSLSSELIASSKDFLLIADEDEHVWKKEKKDFSWRHIYLEGEFLHSVFGDKANGFLVLIDLPDFYSVKKLLVCQDMIFICKSGTKLDDNHFQATVLKDGEEKVLSAGIGSDKELIFNFS